MEGDLALASLSSQLVTQRSTTARDSLDLCAWKQSMIDDTLCPFVAQLAIAGVAEMPPELKKQTGSFS
jgi:hypothetical protein